MASSRSSNKTLQLPLLDKETTEQVIAHGLTAEELEHPMFAVVLAALRQAMYGKGKRHGGNTVPWLEQPLFHYIKMHGRGFATGQAAKKVEEAASILHGERFVDEVLGSIVYCSAAIIVEQEKFEDEGRPDFPG